MVDLQIVKKNKWATAVSVTTVLLLVAAKAHSLQAIDSYVDGPLIYIVTLLAVLLILMNAVNFVLLLVYVSSFMWIKVLTTLAIMVGSSTFWVIAIMFIDERLVFLT